MGGVTYYTSSTTGTFYNVRAACQGEGLDIPMFKTKAAYDLVWARLKVMVGGE